MSVSLCGALLLLGSCRPEVPVPRYCTALHADLGGEEVPPPTTHAALLEVRAILVPGCPPVWHACTPASLGAALCPSCSNDHPPVLGPCCEENADGDLLSNPSPCLRPTSYTYTLLSPCLQISASLSSSPPLPPLAIRHSFILPLSRTSPSKPPSPFLDNVQKRREGEYYPLGCIDIRTQLPLLVPSPEFHQRTGPARTSSTPRDRVRALQNTSRDIYLGFQEHERGINTPLLSYLHPKCYLDSIPPILHCTRPDWNSSARFGGNLNLPRPRSLRPTIPPDSLPIDRPLSILERSTVNGIKLSPDLVADHPAVLPAEHRTRTSGRSLLGHQKKREGQATSPEESGSLLHYMILLTVKLFS